MVKSYNTNNQDSKIDDSRTDWVLYTQQKLFQTVDSTISTKIIRTGNKKKLIASGISEETIEKLEFLTNTDQNNNYLYLEEFNVYIFGFPDPINISGLHDIAINLYRDSDLDNFIEGNKVKIPFTGYQISHNGGVEVKSFSEFIDILTDILPSTPNTLGKQKYYEVVLNPDDTSLGQILGSYPGKS
jgi:hypothetical protein